MFQKLKLRWKILIALVGLSLSPLILTLVFFSGFTGHVIREDMATLAEKSANFVERSIASAQEERVNYIGLLAGSSDLVNAAYYAALTGDAGQLQDLVQEARQHYGFDAIQVLAADGTLLLHSEGGDGSAEASDLTLPALRLSLDGKTGAGIGSFMGRLSITVATPVRLQGQAIAHLVGATFLDDAFAARIKALSGAGIAFYDGDGFTAGSDPGLKALSRDEVIGRGEVRAELDGRSHLLFSKPFGESGGGILLALDRSRELDSQRSMRMMVAAILVVALIAAIGIGLAFSGRLVGSLTEVVVTLEEIAAGEGDLTRSLAVRSGDEVGALASNFNRFVARLRAMVEQTRQAVTSLSGATAQIRQASQGVTDGARSQAESLEESFQAIQGIEESIAGIAESTGSLVQSAEESSSATMELGATIEEIAGQMEKLFQTVIEVSSSISQMSVSSQQIAENIEILSSSTEVTASSITELDASIKEIEENARTTNQLAEAAAQDADQGKATVDATIHGISAIRDSVDRAGAVIRDLGSQSHAIGRILTVIDEVADQTSLLALNAAIIAAQAGEHGRGFAVVADEIRQLADRTAVSTREIAAIITSLQEGTTEAVQAMAAGSERVNQEVARSQAAGEALEKIRTSTLKATEQVRSIMLSTREQARGSQQITSAINQVTMMLGQIATAVRQQNEGTRQLARATEAMEEIASQGKRSTSEQAKGSRQITASVERIRVMIERIDEATRGQSQRTREVVEAVSKIRSIAESTAGRTGELDQAVEILIAQSDSLAGEVGAFRT